MSFADKLTKRAEELGTVTKQAGIVQFDTPHNKPTGMGGFAAALGKRAAETGQKTITVANVVAKDKQAFTDVLKHRVHLTDPSQIKTEFETGDVPKWSFSGLKQFENCPYSTYLAKIARKPQKQSEAASRGTMLHEKAEHYVRGDADGLDPILAKHFARDLAALRDMFQQGDVQLEEEWGIRKDWSPCGYHDKDTWGRGALDVFAVEGDTCRIIDYKSGRKWGNELKHSDQGINYALHAYHRYPELELFRTEFWYIDQGDKMVRNFTRTQLGILLPRYHARAMAMTQETDWQPKANGHNCKYCPYGNGKFGTGDCEYAE